MEENPEVDTSAITYWGDTLSPQKDPKHCRIGFVNINGLGLFATHNKNREFYSFTTHYDFDIFGMAETKRQLARCSYSRSSPRTLTLLVASPPRLLLLP